MLPIIRRRSPRLAALGLFTIGLLIGASSSRAGLNQVEAVPPEGQPGTEAVFSDRLAVSLVQLSVEVLYRGDVLEGLRPENFEVLEEGKRRPLVGFDVIEHHEAAPDGARAEVSSFSTDPSSPLPTPSGGPRTYLFLFDLAYASTGPLAGAVDASRELVERSFRAGDRGAVAFFSAHRGLRLVLPFTGDAVRLTEGLEAFRAMLLRRPDEAIRRLERLRDSAPSSFAGPSAPLVTLDEVGREATILRRNDPYLPHSSVIRRFCLDLAGLPEWTEDAPGKRSVLFFSNGFPTLYLTGTSHRAATLQRMRALLRSLRAEDWSIQAINPGGARAEAGKDTLFYLAHETGGHSFLNFNRMGEALARLQAKTRLTYVLTFEADPEAAPPGRFRRLKVRLKDAPPRARAFHRPGYYWQAADESPGHGFFDLDGDAIPPFSSARLPALQPTPAAR